jgi:hypothetical protein
MNTFTKFDIQKFDSSITGKCELRMSNENQQPQPKFLIE